MGTGIAIILMIVLLFFVIVPLVLFALKLTIGVLTESQESPIGMPPLWQKLFKPLNNTIVNSTGSGLQCPEC